MGGKGGKGEGKFGRFGRLSKGGRIRPPEPCWLGNGVLLKINNLNFIWPKWQDNLFFFSVQFSFKMAYNYAQNNLFSAISVFLRNYLAFIPKIIHFVCWISPVFWFYVRNTFLFLSVPCNFLFNPSMMSLTKWSMNNRTDDQRVSLRSRVVLCHLCGKRYFVYIN